MSSTKATRAERYLQSALVFGVGANELLHAVFDGMNWATNVEIVALVLSMSATTDPDSWRSVQSSVAANAAYAGIWLAHLLSGVIGLLGACLLLKPGSQARTNNACSVSIIGVGIGALLYLVGFVTIASGWFIIHTSPTPPNFLPNAERLFLCYMAVIVFLGLGRR